MLSTFPFDRWGKLRHRDLTVVTSWGNTCCLLSVFIYLVNCVGKDIVWLACWGKNPISILCIKKKFSELLRPSKQWAGCFACASSFNRKENLRVVLSTLPFYICSSCCPEVTMELGGELGSWRCPRAVPAGVEPARLWEGVGSLKMHILGPRLWLSELESFEVGLRCLTLLKLPS